MRLQAFLVASVVLTGCAVAPGPSATAEDGSVDVAEMCSVVQCRFDVRIEMKQEDGTWFDKTFDALPVVQDAGVSIYSGTTVLFEADEVDGRLVNLRLVSEIADPERTISSRLEQDEKGHMLLVTTNPFSKHLRVRMGIMPLGLDRLVKTSSCPVIAGGSSYEMWPYPVFQVYLADMRLIDETEEMSCVE